jgi:hypothetical protein
MLSADIVVVRDGNVYRLLFGYLRLANELDESRIISLEVKGEGTIRIVKTSSGYMACNDEVQLPLLLQ